MKKLLYLAVGIFSLQAGSQTPIDVVENTIKVPAFKNEVFYFGFAEGDQVIFNFQEEKGKELKEIEIIEWPSSSRFMDYKTNKITNKILEIPRTAVYQFRFNNNSVSGRICKFKIQRIPAHAATKNFNTTVYWKTTLDSTITPTSEQFLVKSDTLYQTLVDRVEKISPQGVMNANANKAIVDFMLPEGTLSWSYYIGAGYEGKLEYLNGREKFIDNMGCTPSKIPGYNLMAALAVSGISYFSKAQGADNVKYSFIKDLNSVQAYQSGRTFYPYKQGDAINDASQMKSPRSGKVYIGLLNDNATEPIDVMVKASAVVLNQQWETRMVDKLSVKSTTEPYLNK